MLDGIVELSIFEVRTSSAVVEKQHAIDKRLPCQPRSYLKWNDLLNDVILKSSEGIGPSKSFFARLILSSVQKKMENKQQSSLVEGLLHVRLINHCNLLTNVTKIPELWWNATLQPCS